MGRYRLGVRSNTVEVDATLRHLLASHLVDDDAAPTNYSLRIGGAAASGRRELDLVYWGHSNVVRARTPHRAVQGLLAHLGRWAIPFTEQHLQLRVLALVGKAGGAVLAPLALRHDLPQLDRHLRRVGLRAVDNPLAAVDPATAELMVDPPELQVDTAAFAQLDRYGKADADVPAVAPGRYPLTAWVFAPPEGSQPAYLSRANGVLRAVDAVANFERMGSQAALAALGRVFRATSATAVGGPPAELARTLADLTETA